MHNSKVSYIKREQRKSVLQQQISAMLHTLCEDEPKLSSLYVTKVELSDDGGICYVYMTAVSLQGETSPQDIFSELLPMLKLYKPSMRKNVGQVLQKRYVPDIRFLFDEKQEKIDKINELLDRVQAEREALIPSDDTDGE